MNVINVRKSSLNKQGYNDFADWIDKPKHLYIGRNMTAYVKGTVGSKWKNPFPVKKYGLDKCLELYENHVRTTSLYNELEELDGLELGCWCKPNRCHGDILIKLLKEF